MQHENPQILLWSHPECPYRVAITAPVVNEARILAVEAFYSVPRGGVEIGGVLFGVRAGDLLDIRAHRPIKCQYATGPSFTLSVNDQVGLAGLLQNADEDPDLQGLAPVGWYHSHTRSDIFLSPADLEIYNEFFPERWQIAMVLRPVNLQPTRGAFFFRDRSGAVKSDAPYQEFKLEPPAFGLTPAGEQALAAVAVARGAVAAAITENPPVRELQELPVAPPLFPPQSVEIPASVPMPLPPRENGNRNSGTAAATAVAAVTAPDTAPPVEIAFPPSQRDTEVSLPNFLQGQRLPRERWMTWVWTAILVLVAGAGGAAAYWRLGPVAKGADLGLETYDINGAFLIRWDRESKVAMSATRATIEIQDGGDKSAPIELTRGELARGGYAYVRHSASVSVHMKVDGPYPADEYSNFNSSDSLGSQEAPKAGPGTELEKVVADKEHLKTELINESMRTLELRQQVNDLKRQLTEERAKNTPAAPQ